MRWWTWVALGLVLGGCVASRPARRERFAQLVEPAVEAPSFEPETEVDDHYLGGTRRRREPVLGEEEPRRAPLPRPAVVLGAVGTAALEKIIWGATVRRECPDCEEHHLFPRQEGLRERFKRVGIEVDDWTILVLREKHREAHRQDGGYGPGGKWNWDWEQWWLGREGRRTDADDVFVRALQMILEYRLEPYGMLIQYGHGRAISRDLYDIVKPPRFVR